MQFADETAWRSWVGANQHSYGRGVVTFAQRWAEQMETEIAAGKAIPDIAEAASHKADTEGITGFMYGCAVSMLAKAWKHGEELRRWHNLDVQLGDEGARANIEGGVLNPAILRVG